MNFHPSSPDTSDSPVVQVDKSLGFYRGSLRRGLKKKISAFDEEFGVFGNSWGNLVKDEFMGDRGGYRFRRYAVFSSDKQGVIEQLDDQRHYQTRHYNGLNGGIVREYPCFTDEIINNVIFKELLECARDSVSQARPDIDQWRLEAHQFRILASVAEKGKPVPEGIHRDGVDYVFVFLIDRENVRGGVSRIYGLDGHIMAEMKLKTSLDFMVVNDHSVYHYVTPIYPRKADKPAHRDVLVITVRGEQKVPESAAA